MKIKLFSESFEQYIYAAEDKQKTKGCNVARNREECKDAGEFVLKDELRVDDIGVRDCRRAFETHLYEEIGRQLRWIWARVSVSHANRHKSGGKRKMADPC